jgi:hypothetical protein
MWLLANYPEHPDNLRSENAEVENPEASIPKI